MVRYPDGLDPEELDFQRLYGPWKQSAPADAQRILHGYDGQWWIAGWLADMVEHLHPGHAWLPRIS